MNSSIKLIKGQYISTVYNSSGNIIFEAKYKISRYGIYAKMLAEKSTRTLIFYRNIIVEKDNYNILRLIQRNGNVIDVLIDKEYTELISSKTWQLQNKRYISHSMKNEPTIVLGRWLYTQIHSSHYYDCYYNVFYKNGNSFDCRLCNLEYKLAESATHKYYINNNKSGFVGVSKRDNSWLARWREDGKKHQQSFSIKKYGEQKAKALAIAVRIEKTRT